MSEKVDVQHNGVSDQEQSSALDVARISTLLPATKVGIPHLPASLVQRSALLQRLRLWQAHKLTLITAPTGYGKTTLAICALNDAAISRNDPSSTIHRRWLSIDEDDDTPGHFVQSLTQTLFPLPAATIGMAEVLNLNRSETQRAILLLLHAIEVQADPILVVLDDFHRIQNPAVHQLMALALERTPPNLHWMVLSRSQLPISLGRLRLQKEVLELKTEDLALSDTELRAYLELHQLSIDNAELVNRLQERTHGWISALQLGMLSLSNAERSENAASSTELTDLLKRLHGDNVFVAEYLTGEVLAHLAEPLRSFLLRCSILPKLHPDLCAMVAGVSEGKRLLNQALTQQLFIRALDEDWYELHHLFRELLLSHLHLAESAEAIQALYRRAADWYKARGYLLPAVRSLVMGGAAHLAAELVQSHSHQAVLECRVDDLQQWTDNLPTAQVDTCPRLLLDIAWTKTLNGQGLADAIERAQAGIAAFRRPATGWQDEISVLTLISRYYSGNRHRIYQDAGAVIEHLNENSHLARGWAHIIAAFTHSQVPGTDISLHAQEADNAFAAAGFSHGRLYIIAMQSQRGLHTADLGLLQRNYLQAEEIIVRDSTGSPSDFAFLACMMGEALYWQNQPAEAAEHLQRAWTTAQTFLDSANFLMSHSLLHLCAQADAAIVSPPTLNATTYEEYWQQMRETYPIGPQAIHIHWELRSAISHGEQNKVWGVFKKLGISLETLPEDAPDAAWLCLLTAYTIDGRQLKELTHYLEMMLRRGQDTKSPYITIQINLLRARQLHQLGRHHAARSVLRQALQQVETTGYVRMVLDSPDLLPLLKHVGSKFAAKLVAQMKLHAMEPTQAFSAREKDLLDMLAEDLTVAQISERLVLSPTTVRSYLSRLYTKLGVKNHKQATAWVVRSK